MTSTTTATTASSTLPLALRLRLPETDSAKLIEETRNSWLGPFVEAYFSEDFEEIASWCERLVDLYKNDEEEEEDDDDEEEEDEEIESLVEVFLMRLRKTSNKDHANLRRLKELLDSSFRACNKSRRGGGSSTAPDRGDKRRILLFLVTEMFRVNFLLETPSNCKSLIRAVTSPTFPDVRRTFSVQRRAVYAYYAGKLGVLEDSPSYANEHLSFAWRASSSARVVGKRESPITTRSRKTRVLQLFIPTKMTLGYRPTASILSQLGSPDDDDSSSSLIPQIVNAIQDGNPSRLSEIVEHNAPFLFRTGTYLMVSRLRFIATRNLVRRCVKTWNEIQGAGEVNNKIPIAVFEWAFRTRVFPNGEDAKKTTTTKKKTKKRGEEVEKEEEDAAIPWDLQIKAVISNLIALGLVRGYLAFERNILVLSSKDPFPKTSVAASNSGGILFGGMEGE